MNNSKRIDLTKGNIKKQLLNMSFPMTLGMLGMIIFNLVDAYYIGKLGVNQLAAIAFTFPVVLVVNSLSAGIGLGSSALLSRYIGKGEQKLGEELIFTSFLLGLIVNIVLMTLGILTITPIFEVLGAKGVVLSYIYEYMIVWYLGLIVLVIPQIGNNLIRALGDTKTPGVIMAIAAITNVVLDPIFIFGFGPIPRFGIQGAAIATVLSRGITLIATIYILKYRERLFKWLKLSLSEIYDYWRKILYIGIPNALIQMAVPFGIGIVTKILSSYGVDVVAGFGIASKIEIFALAFINSLAIVIGPFVGQNYGAEKIERIKDAFRISEKLFAFIGIGTAIILFALSRPISLVFTDNESIIISVVQYLSVVPITYGFYGVIKTSATILNVLNKPIKASVLIGVQVFVFYIPLAIIGSNLFGTLGVFTSLSISYLVVSFIAHFFVRREISLLSFKDLD